MERKIEFHDSSIEEVISERGSVEIVFDSFVVLDVTDEFGFEFNKTTFLRGSIQIKNPRFERLPNEGEVENGYIQVRGARYTLVPTDFRTDEPSVLFILQGASGFKIFGDSINVSTKSQTGE